MKRRAKHLAASAVLLIGFAGVFSHALADEKLNFTVSSSKWGKVSFTFDGQKACAVNRGEKMCGTADRIPAPGEAFVMDWKWPQKEWKRPKS